MKLIASGLVSGAPALSHRPAKVPATHEVAPIARQFLRDRFTVTGSEPPPRGSLVDLLV